MVIIMADFSGKVTIKVKLKDLQVAAGDDLCNY